MCATLNWHPLLHYDATERELKTLFQLHLQQNNVHCNIANTEAPELPLKDCLQPRAVADLKCD